MQSAQWEPQNPSAEPSKPHRWSQFKHRFSQVPTRDTISSPSSDNNTIDDGLWDNNDAAFLQDMSLSDQVTDIPTTYRPQCSIVEPKSHDSTDFRIVTSDQLEHESPSIRPISAKPSHSQSHSPRTDSSYPATAAIYGLDSDPSLQIHHDPFGSRADYTRRKSAADAFNPLHTRETSSPQERHVSGEIPDMRLPDSKLQPPRFTMVSDAAMPKQQRKHTRNQSSLVVGLRKLMGKRERDQKDPEDMVISAPIPSSFIKPNEMAYDFLNPADYAYSAQSERLPRALADSTDPSPQYLDSGIQNSASDHLLGGFETWSSPDITSHSAQSTLAQNKVQSTDSLSRPLRSTLSSRMQSSSSSLLNMHNPRQSVIEHTSFDEARQATSGRGPNVNYSGEVNDLMEDLRSTPSPLHHEFDSMTFSHRSDPDHCDARPVRPERRPHSSSSHLASSTADQAPLPSSESWTSSAFSYAPPQPMGSGMQRHSFGLHPHFSRPFPTESHAAQKHPSTQPSSPIYASFDHRANSQDSCASLRKSSDHNDRRRYGGHATHRSLSGASSSKPWSGLLGSPIVSSAASSLSHHKRLSVASISRPLSVSSSTFSDHHGFASDIHERVPLNAEDVARLRRWGDSAQSEPNASKSNLIGSSNFGSSFSPNSALSASYAVGPASSSAYRKTSTAPQLRLPLGRSGSEGRGIDDLDRTIGSSSNTSGITTSSSSGRSSFLSQDPSMYRSKSSQPRYSSSTSSTSPRPPGAGHRSTSSGSSLGGHRKRPSFGLAISPDAHMAFDSIPSPLFRSRRASPSPERADAVQPSLTQSVSRQTPFTHSSLAPGYAMDVVNGAVHTGNGPSSEIDSKDSLARSLQTDASTTGRHRIHSFPLDESDSPPQPDGQWAPREHQFTIYSPDEEISVSTPQSGRMGQASKDITFGSAAGMVSKVFEHPFDLVKVRLQTQSGDQPPRYSGAFDCFKQTYLNEGIRGLYRGLSMPVIGATLENACLFFTYNQLQRGIRWWDGQATSASALKADAEAPLSIAQLAIAAAGAGSVTSFVLTPIELIKCKMQVQMITQAQHSGGKIPSLAGLGTVVGQQARSISSVVDSQAKKMEGPLALAKRTIASDGLRGLWLGQTGTLLRETGGSTAWFLAFESCSRYLIASKKAAWNRTDVTKKDLTSLELVGAGALSGISYNVVLFPADSVKSTMQTEQEMMRGAGTSASGVKFKGTGFFATFNKIYATRGLRGLYAGCGVTCLRSAPSSAIIFLMYNKLEALSDSYGL